ncbi:type II toxin-antitoxin system HicB family antitoxin [Halomonas sp. C22]|uniref:type II toxin-antitoxin system HicB family antitoxin n=1 Tax=Halomonas sp. C22 TaxID=2580567 RepID=UPI0021B23073|nr:type II toxin-antitoxin system HicB family antitoxin [Halomonas sp. C22]
MQAFTQYQTRLEKRFEGHAYGIIVPDLPGCHSAGDSFEEALANAKEAIDGWLEVAVEYGDPLPEATSIEHHMDSPDLTGWIWAVVDIDVTPYQDKSHKINEVHPNRWHSSTAL